VVSCWARGRQSKLLPHHAPCKLRCRSSHAVEMSSGSVRLKMQARVWSVPKCGGLFGAVLFGGNKGHPGHASHSASGSRSSDGVGSHPTLTPAYHASVIHASLTSSPDSNHIRPNPTRVRRRSLLTLCLPFTWPLGPCPSPKAQWREFNRRSHRRRVEPENRTSSLLRANS
jgi:hypothetical protein